MSEPADRGDVLQAACIQAAAIVWSSGGKIRAGYPADARPETVADSVADLARKIYDAYRKTFAPAH